MFGGTLQMATAYHCMATAHLHATAWPLRTSQVVTAYVRVFLSMSLFHIWSGVRLERCPKCVQGSRVVPVKGRAEGLRV